MGKPLKISLIFTGFYSILVFYNDMLENWKWIFSDRFMYILIDIFIVLMIIFFGALLSAITFSRINNNYSATISVIIKVVLFAFITCIVNLLYYYLFDNYLRELFYAEEDPVFVIKIDYLKTFLGSITHYVLVGSLFTLVWEIYDRKNQKIRSNDETIVDG